VVNCYRLENYLLSNFSTKMFLRVQEAKKARKAEKVCVHHSMVLHYFRSLIQHIALIWLTGGQETCEAKRGGGR